MKNRLILITFGIFSLWGCATPPSADPSKVELACAQKCSTDLATCSSGFKFFPIIVQKQCNDNYDVCIKGCPERTVTPAALQQSVNDRLKTLKELRDTGAITKQEYDAKRKAILDGV
jgi:Short C-terminal domain